MCSLSFLRLAPLTMACAPDLVVFSQKEMVTSNRPSSTWCGRSMRWSLPEKRTAPSSLPKRSRAGTGTRHCSVVAVAAGVAGIPVERVVGNQPGLFRRHLGCCGSKPLDGGNLHSPSEGKLHKLPAPFVQGRC